MMRDSIVALPKGLHSGRMMFQPIADIAGMCLKEYDPDCIRRWNEGDSQAFDDILKTETALLLTPTSIRLDDTLLKAGQGRIKRLASVSTGVDHVNFHDLEEWGVPFLHAPGANALSVAEYIMSALSLFFDEKRLLAGDIKAGIIGYGNVGRGLGSLLQNMGMSFQYYDPFVNETPHMPPMSPIPHMTPMPIRSSLRDALQADFISFHVPLTSDCEHATRYMVDDEYMTPVPRKAVIINTSRGGIFSRNHYASVCEDHPTLMDVFPEEPPPAYMLTNRSSLENGGLSSKQKIVSPNIVSPHYVSPHIAGYNFSARAGGARATALAFAKSIGVDPAIVPEIPEVQFDHYVINFLEQESRKLKSDPASFSRRRNHYPPRGDFASCRADLDSSMLSQYQRRLLDRAT